MFSIDNNQNIKISKGDDVSFPLFVNRASGSTIESRIKNPVRYVFEKNDGCEVYFYILRYNQRCEDVEPIIIDTTTYDNFWYDAVTEHYTGDLKITLSSEVTKNLCEDEYLYVIKAKLKDGKINTITNRHKFIVVDDDYNQRVW